MNEANEVLLDALIALVAENGEPPLEAARRMVQDAKRYRFLQRTTCGNTAGGKGSDEECYLSLNPKDMDAAIDAALIDGSYIK